MVDHCPSVPSKEDSEQEHLPPEERRGSSSGYELKVLSFQEKGAIPQEGKAWVIVAKIGERLYFRIFDEYGNKVVDTHEQALPHKSSQIESLRQKLDEQEWWQPSGSDGIAADKSGAFVDAIIIEIATITDHPLSSRTDDPCWFAIQTLSNKEAKVKQYLDKFVSVKGMGNQIFDILLPTETIIEVKKGRKRRKVSKFYPNYLFINMQLYDRNGELLEEPWRFVRNAPNVIDFLKDEHNKPKPVKEAEIGFIRDRIKESEGKAVPNVKFEVGDEVKVNRSSLGDRSDVIGIVDKVDEERGRLTVLIHMFGRNTPLEVEFWQVELVNKRSS